MLLGRFKVSAWEDGDTLRAVDDGRTLAHRKPDGKWSRPVKATPPHKPGKYDSIKPLGGPVTVELTKGKFY